MWRLAAFAVAIVLLIGGSSPAPPDAPFDGTDPGPALASYSKDIVVGGIYDFQFQPRNFARHRVRVTSVRLLSPAGPAIRVLGAHAYPLSDTGPTTDVDEGDLPRICPELFKPRPPTAGSSTGQYG